MTATERTREDSGEAGGKAPLSRAPAALIRIGHLSRLHQDEAELFILRAAMRVELRRGKSTAVRAEGEAIELQVDDPWMSAPHAVIEPAGTPARPMFQIVDRGSRNGVLVGGRRVASGLLRHGDVLTLGRSVFRFHGRPIVEPDEIVALSAGRFGAVRSVSPVLLEEVRVIDRAAPSLLTVLITGESGTGKEIAAGELHSRSKRRGPFVAVNCAAIPETMVEAHLFGHKKGAFTGATEASPGFVAAASGGTLLLDEIGDMPLTAQAKLLRVLEQREVVPLGEVTPRKVDVRVVAATHADLRALVEAGRFRKDLLARLAQVKVELPALVDRREDLGTLVPYFCNEAQVTLSLDAARAILAYDWPLHIRELSTVLRAAALLAGPDRVIDRTHLPAELRGEARAVPSRGPVAGGPSEDGIAGRLAPSANDDDGGGGSCPTRAELVSMLERHGGNVTALARTLGKGKMQVYRWMKRRGIDPDRFR